MSNSIISIENLNKTFTIPSEKRDSIKSHFLNVFRRIKQKKFHAIKDVNLQIKPGEFIGIVGRNGSGKSTLLKLVAGILEKDSGKITVDGQIIPFLELGVGFNPDLSARDNIFLNGTILGITKKYLIEKFDEIVSFAEIEDFIDVPIKNFSSGMQVRLAFAIAIQTQGDIFILDEVLAVGDTAFQEKSLRKIKELKKSGKTILYVSHNLKSIEEHSDKVLVLSRGESVFFGDPDEALTKYDDLILKNQNVRSTAKLDKQEKNKGTLIKSVSIISDQENNNQVSYSKDFSIKIDLNQHDYTDLKVGVGVYSSSGEYVFGVNTKMDDFKLKQSFDTVTLELSDCQLLSGRYFINIVVFSEQETRPIDFRRQALFFKAVGSPKYRGLVSIKHKWQAQ